MMSGSRRKAKPEQVETPEPERVVCIEAFRPAAVARMVERGDYLRRDDPIVKANPAYFAIPIEK